MDVKAEIKWIQNELNEVEDPVIIEAFKNLLKSGNIAEKKRINIDLYNQELEASEKELAKGNFYTQEEVREIAKGWGKK